MSTTWRLLQFLKPFTGRVLLSILLSTATIASGIGLLGTSTYLISRAALQPSIAVLQVAIVGVRFFGISRGIFRYLERLTTHSVNFRLLARLRSWLYRTLEPLAPARLQDFSSGDLLNRILTDIDTLENFYVRVVAPYIAAGLTILGMGLFIGRFDALLGLIASGGLILSGFVIPILAYLASRAAGRAGAALKSRLSTAMVADLQGISDLTACNRAADSSQHLVDLSRDLAAVQRKQVWVGAWANATNGLLTNLTMVAVLWLAIPLVSSGRLEGFMLPVITILVMASFEAVTPLATAAQFHSTSQESGARLFQLESLTPAIVPPIQPMEIPPPPLELELRNVTFQYEAGTDAALQDISLRLTPGKKLALIGPSGAGKTTLVNILLRLWEFDSGEIYLNGLDLRRFSPSQVRDHFSVISQSTYLFNATLGQNLRLAQPGASNDVLLAVLRQAGLSAWIATLPEGLNTWLGEHGMRMSGGERQRLAIARAILQNTPLVILDEPTANLDVVTEAAIIDQLHLTLADKSVLWITHRLAKLEWMDEIIVLDSGRIAERGTHAELIKTGGHYAHLLELQKQLIPLTFSSLPS